MIIVAPTTSWISQFTRDGRVLATLERCCNLTNDLMKLEIDCILKSVLETDIMYEIVRKSQRSELPSSEITLFTFPAACQLITGGTCSTSPPNITSPHMGANNCELRKAWAVPSRRGGGPSPSRSCARRTEEGVCSEGEDGGRLAVTAT